MAVTKEAMWEMLLSDLQHQFKGQRTISLAEASRVIGCKPEILKEEEGLRKFKVGGRYKVPLISLAVFMLGGEDEE